MATQSFRKALSMSWCVSESTSLASRQNVFTIGRFGGKGFCPQPWHMTCEEHSIATEINA
jgi:hypothetical protein